MVTELKLSPRQRQVLELLVQGKSSKEIARALNIAVSTTKIHTSLVLKALGASNRTEAAYKFGVANENQDRAL